MLYTVEAVAYALVPEEKNLKNVLKFVEVALNPNVKDVSESSDAFSMSQVVLQAKTVKKVK